MSCATQVRRERQASTKIQAAWRGRQQRQRLAASHHAAACIQATFKGQHQRRAYLRLRSKALQVQVCCLLLPAWVSAIVRDEHVHTYNQVSTGDGAAAIILGCI